MYIPVSLSENQVIGRNVSLLVLLPEAVCCCLQTCNCGFDICVGRNVSLQVLLPEAVCKLVIVALTLVWYCVPVFQVS